MKRQQQRMVVVLAVLFCVIGAAMGAPVSTSEILALKAKLESGQKLSAADIALAGRINATTSSRIDIQAAPKLTKKHPADLRQSRRGRHALDEYLYQEVPYEWIDISQDGVNTELAGDDETLGPFAIGFDFPYYGQTYSSVYICSNGWISFTDGNSANYGNVGLPSPSIPPNNAIYAFWDDLTAEGGLVSYYLDAANGRFIVNYHARRLMWESPMMDFQIVLYPSGTIRFNYQLLDPVNTSCTVGIENVDGSEGVQVCVDGEGDLPHDQWSIELLEPAGLPVAPQNLAASPSGADVVLNWLDPTVDIHDNPITVDSLQVFLGEPSGGLQIGSVAAGVQTFTHQNAPSGTQVYTVRAFNEGFGGSAARTTIVFGLPSYYCSFDTTDGGWVADPVDGFRHGTPNVENGPQPYSGTNVWGTSLDAPYMDNQCFHLTLDPGMVVASPTAYVEFEGWFETESCCDGINFKVSTDNGTTWNVVDPEVGYSTQNMWLECLQNEAAWVGSSGGWQHYVLPIGSYQGQVLQFRFDFGSDGSITYPGFFIDNVVMWGLNPPTLTTVSGTISLDGGAGRMANVVVSSSGFGTPVAQPNEAGEYTINNVVAGNRTISASLRGYHTASTTVDVPAEGATGVNLTLRRLDPPAPTGLAAQLNSTTGAVTLTWANADTLVDRYRIYRKLRTDMDWVLVDSSATTQATNLLPADGVFHFRVSAVDTNVTLPAVESLPSSYVEVIYGNLPPVRLQADGVFDNRIALTWGVPGSLPSIELAYDDGDAEFYARPSWVAGPTDYQAVRFTPPSADSIEYPLPIQVVSMYFDTTVALPWVAVCPDVDGRPDLDHPLATWNNVITAEAPGWLRIDADGQVMLTTAADFWMVWQYQPNGYHPAVGCDQSPNFTQRSIYSTEPGSWWTQWGSDYMCHVWVGSRPALVATHSTLRPHLPHRFALMTEKNAAGQLQTVRNPQDRQVTAGPVRATTNHAASFASVWNRADGRGRRSLDEVTHYRVYRGATMAAELPGTTLAWVDTGRVENVNFAYHVTALYDNGRESPASDTVVARCNMAPGEVTNLTATSVGTTMQRLTWTDPAVNLDGSPCRDLDSVRIYRDSVQIGSVARGVQQFTSTPPENNRFYNYQVQAIDEVPNVSPMVTVTAAVVSPWRTVEFNWVDISSTGVNTGLMADDETVGAFALGFSMPFYGQTYDSVFICSNGWASFSRTTSVDYWNQPLPDSDEPNNVMYLFWDDMFLPGGGSVMYQTDAVNRRFIISWINVPHIGGGDERYDFQMILDASGGVTYQYLRIPMNTTCTVGVENATGTDAIQLCFDNAGPFIPTDSTAIRFWGGPTQAIIGTVRASGTNQILPQTFVWAEGAADTTVTDSTGAYRLAVTPGTYTVHYEHVARCDSIAAGVVVVANENTTVNATLSTPAAQFSHSSIDMGTSVGRDTAAVFYISNRGGHCPLEFSISDTSAWLRANPATGSVAIDDSVAIRAEATVAGFPVGTELTSALVIAHGAATAPYTLRVSLFITEDGVNDDNAALPDHFALRQNFPNPFNPSTSLYFDVPTFSRVQLTVFNVMGQEVARPVDAIYGAGRHQVRFDGSALPSGMYLVRMQAGSFSAVSRMMLLK